MQASLPDPTAPNVGGVPQSHNFFHPHFSNQAKVLAISDTFNIAVNPLASMIGKDNSWRNAFIVAYISSALCLRSQHPLTSSHARSARTLARANAIEQSAA